MSDSNWRNYTPAGVGLAVAALLLFAACVEPKHQSPMSQPQEASGGNVFPAVDKLAPLPDLQEQACAEAQQAWEGDPDRIEKRDLCAQLRAAAAAEKASEFALPQLVIGAAGLLAIIITLALNARATTAATDQARTARRALEDLERPYLISTVAQERTREEQQRALLGNADETFPFSAASATAVHFANVGRTPAMLVKRVRRRIERWDSTGPPPPIIPVLGEFDHLDAHGAVVTNLEPSQEFHVTGEFQPARPEDAQPGEVARTWYFQGYVIYRDLANVLYVGGFCHWYSPVGGRWLLLTTRATPDEYNYDRKWGAPEKRRPYIARVWAAIWGR